MSHQQGQGLPQLHRRIQSLLQRIEGQHHGVVPPGRQGEGEVHHEQVQHRYPHVQRIGLRSQGTGSGSWKSKRGIFDLRSVVFFLEPSWDLFLFGSFLEVDGGECLGVGGLAGALRGNLGLVGIYILYH